MKFETITITEWRQIFELEPEGGGWVYRGHSDVNWPLESSLRRAVLRNQIGYSWDTSEILYAERASLKTFRSRAHFYLADLPSQDDHVAWLTIMQHHGAPTRLLDFTRSIYVAIYFALADASGDSCVWAISDSWLRDEGTKLAIKLGYDLTDGLRFGELASMYKAANRILSENRSTTVEDDFTPPLLLMIDPERQIPRLAVQQGLFLFPTSLDASFMDNMAALKPDKYPHVKKIILKHSMRSHALMHLKTMNVTAESLFPGIDGFAKSLAHHDML